MTTLRGYAELQASSNFSFLRGASHPQEMMAGAATAGLSAIALTDRNTLSGIVRIEATRLVVSDLGSTEMGCDAARHAQDEWLASVLSANPAYVISDGQLQLHAADTMAVGGQLNDAAAVRVLVDQGRDAVLRLVKSGVPFDRGPDGPELTLEAGHSRRRILHANGGATGEMISAPCSMLPSAMWATRSAADRRTHHRQAHRRRATATRGSRSQLAPAMGLIRNTGWSAGSGSCFRYIWQPQVIVFA
jgi:hypothetical protein